MNDASGDQKDVYPIGKKNPTLPFYPAVRAGDFIFVSGQVAKDPDGNTISGTIEKETRIEAIRQILAEEGRPSPMLSASRPTRGCPRLRPLQPGIW
jgi:enamine deaminase RidA (YjgF/YER057c/UK114 family)